jgi:hypothetical protein
LFNDESTKVQFLDKQISVKVYQHMLALYGEMVAVPVHVSDKIAEAIEIFKDNRSNKRNWHFRKTINDLGFEYCDDTGVTCILETVLSL